MLSQAYMHDMQQKSTGMGFLVLEHCDELFCKGSAGNPKLLWW
jgi:hypothetical protein